MRKITKSEILPVVRSINPPSGMMISKESRGLEENYNDIEFGRSQTSGLWQKYLENLALHPWVYASIMAIARNIAKCPFKLMQWKGDRGIEQKNHPLIDLIENPNEYYSGYDLKEGYAIILSLAGNVFVEKSYNKKIARSTDIPKELYLLQSGKMVVIPGRKYPVARYEYGKKPIQYEPFEIIHFKYMNPISDAEGLSPLSPLTNTLITDYYAIKYNKNFFKRGAKPSGHFYTDKSLNDESFNRLKEQVQSEYAGEEGQHKILVTDNNLKYNEMSKTQKDIEYTEGRKQSCGEILGVTGTQPGIIGILEYANYSNMEEQKKTFINELIMAVAEKFAWTLTLQLSRPIDKLLYFEPDYRFIKSMAENEEKRTTMDVALVTNGIELINEVRERRGLKPVPWGNTWHRPFNLYPVDEVKPEPDITKRLTKEEKKEQMKEQIWKEYVNRTRPYEDEMVVVVRKFAKKQMEEVMNAIDKNYRPAKVGKVRKDARVDNLMFDITIANKQLQKQMAGVLSDVMQDFGNVAIKRLGGSIAFDMSDPRVVDYLNTKVFEFSEYVNDTTQRQLGDTLAEGYGLGESVEEMKSRVQDVFDGLVRAEPYRARQIARTEVISASNNASLTGYKMMGASKKEWLTALDDRTRGNKPTDEFDHVHADGQLVDIDDDFMVSSEPMAYPGDPRASVGNLVNCRCTLLPVVE